VKTKHLSKVKAHNSNNIIFNPSAHPKPKNDLNEFNRSINVVVALKLF
jgi:hypothetical protein